jgi:hypothetical protein
MKSVDHRSTLLRSDMNGMNDSDSPIVFDRGAAIPIRCWDDQDTP